MSQRPLLPDQLQNTSVNSTLDHATNQRQISYKGLVFDVNLSIGAAIPEAMLGAAISRMMFGLAHLEREIVSESVLGPPNSAKAALSDLRRAVEWSRGTRKWLREVVVAKRDAAREMGVKRRNPTSGSSPGPEMPRDISTLEARTAAKVEKIKQNWLERGVQEARENADPALTEAYLRGDLTPLRARLLSKGEEVEMAQTREEEDKEGKCEEVGV